MADEKAPEEGEVAPKAAVEVEEKDLDEAAGGSLNFTRTTNNLSINYTGLESGKVDTDLTSGGGPHVAPEQKI